MLIDCIMQVNRNELITTKTNTRIKTYCLSSSSYQKSTNLKIRLTRAHVHVNFNYRNFSSCWVRVANTVGPCSPTQVSVKTSQQAFLHWKIPTVKLASLRHASYNVTSSFLWEKESDYDSLEIRWNVFPSMTSNTPFFIPSNLRV